MGANLDHFLFFSPESYLSSTIFIPIKHHFHPYLTDEDTKI